MKKILLIIAVILGLSITSVNPASANSSSSTKRVTNIEITINHHKLQGTLNNTSAAKAFKKKLPITLRFRKYPGLPEKVADLNSSLPTKGMPDGARGRKGYIGYWSPDQRIVFYYGNEQYWEGIHLIGKFTSKNYATVIKEAPNNTRVRIVEKN